MPRTYAKIGSMFMVPMKRPPGRPPAGEAGKPSMLSVRIPKTMQIALEELARSQGKSVPDLTREWLAEKISQTAKHI